MLAFGDSCHSDACLVVSLVLVRMLLWELSEFGVDVILGLSGVLFTGLTLEKEFLLFNSVDVAFPLGVDTSWLPFLDDFLRKLEKLN